MKSQHTAPTTNPAASRDVSLDYLRALITVLVLVIHCSAPYTHTVGSAQSASWQSAVPIVDRARSYLLDYVLCFLDVSTMSLMFFISGLFIYPALRKKGGLAFCKDRVYRLGLPFLAMTLLLMPVAYYAPWNLQHPGASFGRFLIVDQQSHFRSGPGWFLWMLLLFDAILALLYVLAGGLMPGLLQRARRLSESSGAWALFMVLAGVALYVPLGLRYWGLWVPFLITPFMMQPSRALFYAAWVVAGMLAGSGGIEQGLLDSQGRLARHWPAWVALAFIAGNALFFGSPLSAYLPLSLRGRAVFIHLLWVLADVGICFGLLALFRARVRKRRAWADSLARYAYAIYALHYVFALWIERWLLPAPLPALAKFSIALCGTLSLSWLAAVVWLRLWRIAGRLFRRDSASGQAARKLHRAA